MGIDANHEADIKEFTQLLGEDLAAGETDKVTTLFQYNKTLYETVGRLIKDERILVRVGLNMVIDELIETRPEDVHLALPGLIPLLADESPTVRGDTADLIGTIGNREQVDILKPLLKDPHPQVVEIVKEAIDMLMSSQSE